MKAAFFRELERRHGGPLSYEDLQEWEFRLDDESELELEQGISNASEGSGDRGDDGSEHATHSPQRVAPPSALPACGWLTPSTPHLASSPGGRQAEEGGVSSDASDSSGGAQCNVRPRALSDEDLDCVVTESLAPRCCSRAPEAMAAAAESVASLSELLDAGGGATVGSSPAPPSPRTPPAAGRLSVAGGAGGAGGSSLPEWHMATPQLHDSSASGATSAYDASSLSTSAHSLPTPPARARTGLGAREAGVVALADVEGEGTTAPCDAPLDASTADAAAAALFPPPAEIAVARVATAAEQQSERVCMAPVPGASPATTTAGAGLEMGATGELWGGSAESLVLVGLEAREAAEAEEAAEAAEAEAALAAIEKAVAATEEACAVPPTEDGAHRAALGQSACTPAPHVDSPLQHPPPPPEHYVPSAASMRLLTEPPAASRALSFASSPSPPASAMASPTPPAQTFSPSPPRAQLPPPPLPPPLPPLRSGLELPPSMATLGAPARHGAARARAPTPDARTPSASPTALVPAPSMPSAFDWRRPAAAADTSERRDRLVRSLTAEVGLLKSQLGALREQYDKERDEWHKEEARLKSELVDVRRLSGYRQHVLDGGNLNECGRALEPTPPWRTTSPLAASQSTDRPAHALSHTQASHLGRRASAHRERCSPAGAPHRRLPEGERTPLGRAEGRQGGSSCRAGASRGRDPAPLLTRSRARAHPERAHARYGARASGARQRACVGEPRCERGTRGRAAL